MHHRSRGSALLAALMTVPLANLASAQTEMHQDSQPFHVTHTFADPKDLSSTSPRYWEPLRLDHHVSAAGIADFTPPQEKAMVESRVSSVFTVEDHPFLPGPGVTLSETVVSARARVLGDAGVNPSCEVFVEFTLMGDVHVALSHNSTSNLVGDTPGELTQSLASRGLGTLDYSVGPTVLRLVYTMQDIQAGADVHYACSVAPAASLDGALRATPGRVAVVGSFIDWEPGSYYEKKIASRLHLGELRASPDMISTSSTFTASVPWEWDPVFLKLVLTVLQTTHTAGGFGSLGTFTIDTWRQIVGNAELGTFGPGARSLGW